MRYMDGKTITHNPVDTNNQFAILKIITNGKNPPIRFRPYGAFSFYGYKPAYLSARSYIANTDEIT